LRSAPVDRGTAIVVLTHDHKFDVPLPIEALRTDAAYIGAMGSRTTTEERAERLRAAGATEDQLQRLRAPIGLRIGARSPEEVAVSIAAELIEVTRDRVVQSSSSAGAVAALGT
jgi:xanthine dehydrogenase accessory factor